MLSINCEKQLQCSFSFDHAHLCFCVWQTTSLFQLTVRYSVETESYFTSVERICEYIKTCNPEEPTNKTIIQPPSKDWPDHGEIRWECSASENQKFTLRPIDLLSLQLFTWCFVFAFLKDFLWSHQHFECSYSSNHDVSVQNKLVFSSRLPSKYVFCVDELLYACVFRCIVKLVQNWDKYGNCPFQCNHLVAFSTSYHGKNLLISRVT